MKILAIMTIWQHSDKDRKRQLRVLNGLTMQDVGPHELQIVVIHNASSKKDPPLFGQKSVSYVATDLNLGCQLAHRIAGCMNCDYVLKIDDDVEITCPDFVRIGADVLNGASTIHGLGIMGRTFPKNPPFYPRNKGGIVSEDGLGVYAVDAIVGKLMLYRASLLKNMPCKSDGPSVEDLQLCATVPRSSFLVGGFWHGKYRDLSRPKGTAMSDETKQWQEREAYAAKHWGQCDRAI
jgi:hypothetical protein